MSLTSTSKWFKKFTFYLGGIVIFYYILILVLIPSVKATIAAIIPDKNPPTLAYGILPSLEFTTKNITGNQSYELNTKTGRLPTTLPKRAKVYEIKQMLFSYNAGKSAQNDAAYLGFADGDLITDLKGKTYKWRSLKTGGTLEIEIDSKKLTMNTNLSGKSSTYKTGSLTETTAVENATSMLEATGRIDDLYRTGTNTLYKGKYTGNKLVETQDRRDAQLYRVDFFRTIGDTEKEKYKIVGPDPKVGLLQVFLGAEETGERYTSKADISPATFPILDLNYNEINTTSTATYPLVDISQAWAAIKKGQGIVASVTPKGANPFTGYDTTEVNNILINDIYIAYYEAATAQKYLQPIYVFEGNYKATGTQGGDITIYFPAVTGEYIQAVGK